MTTIRKTYSPTFKAEVAQEVLKGEMTINQISSDYGVHPNVIGKWKRSAVKSMPNAFDEEGRTHNQIAPLKAEHQKQKELLYAEIGRLTTQLNCRPVGTRKKCDTGLAHLDQNGSGRAQSRKP